VQGYAIHVDKSMQFLWGIPKLRDSLEKDTLNKADVTLAAWQEKSAQPEPPPRGCGCMLDQEEQRKPQTTVDSSVKANNASSLRVNLSHVRNGRGYYRLIYATPSR